MPALARIVLATVAFMVAMVMAIAVSWWKTRHVSPMLLISGALVLVFGGLTIWFNDQRFIQMKPTFVYAILAAVLGFGLATGRPLMEQLLGTAYPGLSEPGWRKLTINWVWFFVVMAMGNEAVWRVARDMLGATEGWDAWAIYKVWIVIPATLIFAVANLPMLMRHGLKLGEDAPLPPEG